MQALSVQPDLVDLCLERTIRQTNLITLVLSSHQMAAACPLCAQPSARVQSRYLRTLADLPIQGVEVRIHLQVRRFFCETPECRRRIFAERMPAFAPAYARYSTRFTAAARTIGFALGGEAGARLASKLGLPISPDTILRRVRCAPRPVQERPRVVGVDDWAMRKGRRYATIVVDLERHRPIDLLADRTSETLATWLTANPSIETISRDRSSAFAEASRLGAPQAVQVADRWHLLVNLGDTLERLLTRHHSLLRKAATTNGVEQLAGPSAVSISAPPIELAVGETPRPAQSTALAPQISRAERDKAARRENRLARYNEVVSLRAAGIGIRETSRRLGLSRQTVKSYIEAGEFPERAQAEPKPSILAPFVPYIDEQWTRGCGNATTVFRELREKGYRGGVTIVRQYVAGLRPPQRRRVTPTERKVRPPSPRRAALWLCREGEELEPEQQAFVERLCALSSDVATAATLARDFARLVKQRGRSELGRWLEAAEGSGVAELKGFAEGVRQDQAAVEEALSSPYSNGQTEGQINRLKMIKRQMYGRAKLDLLRARLLQAA